MGASRPDGMFDSLRRAVGLPDRAELTDGQLLGRFVEQRDGDAFAAIVQRHGPMVWGVCRRALGPPDAEDAFQATFLVLVRKAAAVSPREMVGHWLYGVARRVALEAKRAQSRRRLREAQVAGAPEPASPEQGPWCDLGPVLDEELGRLPGKYRAVIVLCDLEGKTRTDAARQLGVPGGSVAGWLARGRAMLAKRLTRRGVSLTAGGLAATLAKGPASAGVPAAVESSTVRAASTVATGEAAAAGAISAQAAALTERVIKAMLMTKLKLAAVVLAAVACVGALAFVPVVAGPPVAAPVAPAGPGEAKAAPPANAAEGPARAAAPPQEAQKLVGTWTALTGEVDGQLLSPAERQIRWVIADGKVTWEGPEKKVVAEWAIKIDTNKVPHEIDLQTGPQVLKGIYEVDGNTLILSLGQDRPTEFKTAVGSKTTLMVLRREGGAAKAK